MSQEQPVHAFLQIAMHVALVVSQLMTAMWYLFTVPAFDFLHPIVFGGIRALICTTSLIPVMLYIDRNMKYETKFSGWRGSIMSRIPSRIPLLLLITNGASLTLQQVAFIAGLSYTTPALTSLFGPASIITTSFVSIMIKNEDKSFLKLVGIAVSVLATFGTIVANVLSKEGGQLEVSWSNLIGGALLTIGTLFSAVYNNLQTFIMRKYHVPPISVSTWSCFFSGIFTSAISFFFMSQCDFKGAPWQVWYGLVFAAIFGASIPWTIGTATCKYLKPTMVVIHSCTLPLWTALLGYLLLGSLISWHMAVGALAIVTGVLIVAVAKWQENNHKAVPIEISSIEIAPVEKELDISSSTSTPIAGDEITTLHDIADPFSFKESHEV
jgi:drug/metabolite transporter (DMT)-like permease